MLRTAFTGLTGCRVPIQLAPMPVVSLELATAVAEAGGLAMFSGLRSSATYLVDMLDKVASRTGARAGVNFIIRFLDTETVKAVAPRASVVEFFYGDPDRMLVELAHAGGALACWHVGSREEAAAAERAGCDLIAAQGIEAGGHVRGYVGLFPLLGEVLDAIRIPVIASGGVGTARSMAAALAAGAAAVRIGTRFLAAREADAHPAYVEALIRARAEDTILTETFSVNWPDAPHRVLRSCVDAAKSFSGAMVGEGAVGGSKYPVPRFAPPTPNRATVGEISAMALYAGHSVDAVRRVQPAAEIVRELSEGAERLLRAWAT
ncbi:MAG: nitronate monooxygenase [Betaproteobacteria bacterium]|nr:MAG: nitronate monooxygenase [Betaproteobacteria bacterium]